LNTKLAFGDGEDACENPLIQWSIIPCERRIRSFGIVNARTRRFLKFTLSTDSGSVITVESRIGDDNDELCCYSTTNTDYSTVTISNRFSGTLLDHFCELGLEALSNDKTHQHHQWKLIPVGTTGRHFQIKNVATGKLIEERMVGFPNIHSEQTSGNNNGQLWELVTTRSQIYDRFNEKDHVVAVLSSALRKEQIPPFALVNRGTGWTLHLKSSFSLNGVVTVKGGLQDIKNLWYLYPSTSEDGAYAIASKESGMVLDHFRARTLEAQTTNGNHRHHQWRLTPCGPDRRYFRIENVATGQAIEEWKIGAPGVYPSQTDNPFQQWRIIPLRAQSWDFGATLDNFGGNDAGQNPLLQWSLTPCESRIQAVHIVNASTRRTLEFVPGTDQGSVITKHHSTHDVANQWSPYKNTVSLVNGEPISLDKPTVAIANRFSGMVLDHFCESSLEALTTSETHPHHQWRLIPSTRTSEGLFKIQNVASGKMLEERNIGTPNIYPDLENSETGDWAQLWAVTSAPTQVYDRFNEKDHVVHTMSSVLQAEDEVPAFALVNRLTGRTLQLKWPFWPNGVITVEGKLQDNNSQWHLYASRSVSGAYAIRCKESGVVLDHFCERTLEAQT
jgi:hypothetical protein